MSAVNRIAQKIESEHLESGFVYIGRGCGCGFIILCFGFVMGLFFYGWPF